MKWLLLFFLMVSNANATLNAKDLQHKLDPYTVKFAQKLEKNFEEVRELSKDKKIDFQQVSEKDRAFVNSVLSSTKQSEVFLTTPAKQSDFYIFVSLSMKDKNLQQLLNDAAKYNAVVVLRGLKNNSMKETVQHLAKFFSNTSNGLIIDPELFTQFGINKVPSFVLSDEKNYDILSGNVTPHFALQKFSQSGGCANEAIVRLRS